MLFRPTAVAATLCPLLLSLVLAAPPTFQLVMMAEILPYIVDKHPYVPPPSYSGDVLNVTRCYCEDSNNQSLSQVQSDGQLHSQTSNWGHYYRFDYYNWHHHKLYSLSLSCNSRQQQVKNDNLSLPVCWEEGAKRKDCGLFPDGSKFCYQVGSLGTLVDEQTEHYSWNRQLRGLPKKFSSMKPDSCERFCRQEVGMDVARDIERGFVKTWKGGEGADRERVIESTLKSYNETDNMCHGCL